MKRAIAVGAALLACSGCTERAQLLQRDRGLVGEAGPSVMPTGTSTTPPPRTTLSQPVCQPPALPSLANLAVNRFGDGTPGSCTSLVFAEKLRAGGHITFDCGDVPLVLELTPDLTIAVDTFIDGGDGPDGGQPKITLSANNSRAFSVLPRPTDGTPVVLRLRGLTIENGLASRAGGGAIALTGTGGELIAESCVFRGNKSPDAPGGAVAGRGRMVFIESEFDGNSATSGGAVALSSGTLTIVLSKIHDNKADENGGGVQVNSDNARTSICGSTFDRNTAGSLGGGLYVSSSAAGGSLAMDQTEITNNAVEDATPGAMPHAGAIFSQGTDVTITNSTVAENRAPFLAGVWVGGFRQNSPGSTAVSGRLSMTNVTIADNVSNGDPGGGLWLAPPATGTVQNCTIVGNKGGVGSGIKTEEAMPVNAKVTNSIIANNGSGAAANCEQTFAGVPNLQWPGETTPCTPDILFQDPLLGPLVANGGPTRTMRPRAGSPAIGRGVDCATDDQRKKSRPASGCALGAYEPD